MKSFLSFLKEALSSVDGASSKRLITFIIVVSLIISLFVAQLTGKTPPEWMFSSLVSLSMVGLGTVAAEIASKWAKTPTSNEPKAD